MSGTGEPARADAGTTLIEALVVVTISTLVAVIGFPQLQQGLLGLAQNQTVALVAERLRETRAQALRLDRPVVFAVAADGRGYAMSGSPVAGLPGGVSLTSQSGAGIAFFGDGSSSGGEILVSAGRRTVPVRVAPDAGAVAIGGG
jgi:general secretion pathway protein H